MYLIRSSVNCGVIPHFMRYCECVLVYCPFFQGGGSDTERTKKKRRGDRYSVQTSLIVAALKKMLPIGLNMCSPADQELINLAKIRYSLVVFFLTLNELASGKHLLSDLYHVKYCSFVQQCYLPSHFRS